MKRRASLPFDGVERAGAGGAPTAFRIWRAGPNDTDHGPTNFSERSATLLMAEQALRGNRYSIDVDHLSLDKDAPIESHAAVGWFSLAVRDGELWAVDVEWINASIRSGLVTGAWKYFSPAYDVNSDGEVVSFWNLAVTNNPATHRVTALAARGAMRSDHMAKAKKMSWGDIKAALDGDDENAKATAYAAIKAAFPDDAPEKKDAADEPAPESKDEGKKDAEGEPEKKDAADEPEKKDAAEKCASDEPEKKDTSVAASILAAQDARLRKLEAENDRLRKREEAEERTRLIASRVMSKELASTLASKPLAFVKDVCDALPKRAAVTSTEHVQATRGETQREDGASALPPEEKAKLDERMGLKRVQATVRHEGVHQVFPVMTPEEARAFAASKGGK